MIKRIKQNLRDRFSNVTSNIDKAITKINQGNRPRRGIGTAGLKPDKSHYKVGGKHETC